MQKFRRKKSGAENFKFPATKTVAFRSNPGGFMLGEGAFLTGNLPASSSSGALCKLGWCFWGSQTSQNSAPKTGRSRYEKRWEVQGTAMDKMLR